jgi:hypothetical protein
VQPQTYASQGGSLEECTVSVLCTTFSVDELLRVLADPSTSVMQVEQPPGALYTCLSKRSLFGAGPYGGNVTVLFCLLCSTPAVHESLRVPATTQSTSEARIPYGPPSVMCQKFGPLKGNKERTHSLAFSHAGKRVVSGCWNSNMTVTVWKVRRGALEFEPRKAFDWPVAFVAFSSHEQGTRYICQPLHCPSLFRPRLRLFSMTWSFLNGTFPE